MDLPIRRIDASCKHGVPLNGRLCFDVCNRCREDWEDARLDAIVESLSEDEEE